MLTIFCLLFFYFYITYVYGVIIDRFSPVQDTFDVSARQLLYPFVGLSIIISILQNTGGLIGAKYAAVVLMLFSMVLLYLCRTSIAKNLAKYRIIGIAAVVLVAIYLVPVFLVGRPTSFSTINHDLIYYLAIPDWLMNHGYFSNNDIDLQYHPFYSISDLHLSRFSRVGADYFNSLSMTIFNLTSLETFNILSVFFVVMLIISIFFACKYCFKLDQRVVIIIIILMTLNSFVYWMYSLQYMPQIAGNAIYIIALGTVYRSIVDKNYKLIVISGLLISALVSIYSEYLLYLIVPVFGFAVLFSIKNKKEIKDTFLIGLFTLIAAIVFNPTAFYLAVKYNLYAFHSTQNMEGIVPYIPVLKQLLMFSGVQTLNDSINPLYSWLAIIIFLIFLYGIKQLRANLSLLLVPLLGFVIALFIYFYFVNKFPYGYYKTMMFSQFIFIILFSIGLNRLSVKMKVPQIAYIIVVMVLLLNVISIGNMQFKMLKWLNDGDTGFPGVVVTDGYYDLLQMKHMVSDDSIIQLRGMNMHDQHILAFLLKDKMITFDNNNHYFGYLANVISGQVDYVLSKKMIAADIYQIGEVIWENDLFVLTKVDSEGIELSSDWNGLEQWGGIPTRWTTGSSSFRYSNQNSSQIILHFDAFNPPGFKKRTLNILLNGQFVDEITVDSNTVHYKSRVILLENDKNEITFNVFEGAVHVGDDPRDLGIAIQNLSITEN